MGSPFYRTTGSSLLQTNKTQYFDSVRLTQIDINFQQVVLQLRRRLGTTTDPVLLYPRPRLGQIEYLPLNSLIHVHNLSKNIKSRRDFYVIQSAKRTRFTNNENMEIIYTGRKAERTDHQEICFEHRMVLLT